MMNFILGSEIIFGGSSRDFIGNIIQFFLMKIGKENRLGIHICNTYMVLSIFFFIGAGKFMFLDDIIQIIINRSAAHNACLLPAVHGQLVNIKTFILILKENSILH